MGFVAAAWLVCSLATFAANESPSTAAPQAGARHIARVHELIGPARCQADADCRTVAIGAKACGGPQAYLAWSTRTTDADALARAVAAYNEWAQTAQAKGGVMSTCDYVSDPGAVCRAAAPAEGTPPGPRSCQLGRAPAGAAYGR